MGPPAFTRYGFAACLLFRHRIIVPHEELCGLSLLDTVRRLGEVRPLTGEKDMPLLVLSKEVQTFIRACEHLLSMPSSPPLPDDEGALVDYYIRELLNKYGAPKEDRAGAAESCNTRHGDQSPGS